MVGTNGILVPPPGYLAGVRALCDEHGIVFIADEVMAGFGRCGSGSRSTTGTSRPTSSASPRASNSSVPLGGVIISQRIADTFAERPYGGLTYSGHPLACAVGEAASIEIFKEEGLVERAAAMGTDVIGPVLADLAERRERGRGARSSACSGPSSW
ncbi:MAG: aminotransferase class III-fold pyridoxal phosphate-dependent enzyme [Acidimicrobiales bacterium]